MGVGTLSQWLVWTVLLGQMPAAATGATASAPPRLPDVIVTRHAVFAIPFRVESPKEPARQITEVQLHVSNDRGARWQLYAKAPPTQPQFMFRASGDGEYWFLIRTVNRSGLIQPETIGSPGLRVAVDTKPPVMRLATQAVQPRQVVVRWEVDKPTLKPDSLGIQYRALPNGPWQSVLVGPSNSAVANTPAKGEATIWLKPGESHIQIRSEVSDTAGNLGFGHSQIVAGESSNSQSSLASIPGSNPSTSPAGSPSAPKSNGPASPAWSDSPASRPTLVPASVPAGSLQNGITQGANTQSAINENARSAAPMEGVKPVATQPSRAEPVVAQSFLAAPAGETARAETAAANTTASSMAMRSTEPRGNVAISIIPAVANQWDSDENKVLSLTPSAADLPAGVRPRMVNSRLFELEYDVDAVGPSGVGRVELWGTRDNGQNWSRYTLDNDHRSPLSVTVDEDGIYGFRVVAANGAGVGAKPPTSGDPPDVWVGVDLAKPSVQILIAQQGVDAEAGRLIIAWKAADKMLADRPVSLLYSATQGGPWLTVANRLENSGRHAWPIDNQTPPQVYLRLEVHDAAGNVGAAETSEPIIIDQSSPSIRIRDVRSHSQTGLLPPGQTPAAAVR